MFSFLRERERMCVCMCVCFSLYTALHVHKCEDCKSIVCGAERRLAKQLELWHPNPEENWFDTRVDTDFHQSTQLAVMGIW